MWSFSLFASRRQVRCAAPTQPQQTQFITGVGSLSTRVLVTTASILLIFSSAGFGASFALTQGLHHGPALAVFAVCMALGLEFAKPFSVEAAFACFRRLSIGSGLALALLAAVAVAYSLTAELSLMAMTRGDVVAGRQADADASHKARGRYERAERELVSLAPARPASELQALIDGVLANPKAGNCTALDGPYTREWCPRVTEWRAEIGRSVQRAKLEAAMAQAEADQRSAGATKAPDPGAAALSAYLAAFGLTIPAGVLSEWLVLVGVLALEAGSAMSVLLVRAVDNGNVVLAKQFSVQPEPVAAANAGPSKIKAPELSKIRPEPAIAAVPVRSPRVAGKARGQRRGRPALITKDQAARKLVNTIRVQGGRAPASVRGLATLINGKRSTVHGALLALTAAGVVERIGSEIVLRATA